MAMYHRNSDKRKTIQECKRQEEEVVGSLCRLGNIPLSPKMQLEQEKRIRREIANSNERRRMQSINAGFQSLRALLPQNEGEKLSKAAILQHTTEYIYQLEQEKTKLLSQNCQLKRLLNSQLVLDNDCSNSGSPLPKRKKIQHLATGDSSDEGIGNMSPHGESDSSLEDVKSEVTELRIQLERERRLRMMLEEQTHSLENQMCVDHTTEQIKYYKQAFEPLTGMSIGQTTPQEKLFSAQVRLLQTESVSTEVPQDLSGKKPCLHHTADSVVQMSRSESKELQNSTSRQNLETIVEAIRHVEGDHLFCDDPEPPRIIKTQPISESQFSNTFIVRQHVIHCPPPVTFPRPGVIVSNHS
ncbi:transcription factor AP-4-like [Limulus polyphemus]|uniref:Transcription factor AP-4-like n=1 Tax=Limulus polyphemus TaxID=6850 RepID=A0ABM1BAI2_LIMPO|nr:transcription factor AP-4-like [Limulus polyphemus]